MNSHLSLARKLRSSAIFKGFFDLVVDVLLHDLIEDSLLAKLEIRVDKLLADDEISNYVGDDHIQHITICTAADVKPVYSNNLLDEGYCEFIDDVVVPCRVGAFVVFEDDNTGWVFNN